MEENAGNVFFCNQIIYENTYEKKVSCCFINLYLLSYWLGSTRFCLEIQHIELRFRHWMREWY